MSSGDRAILWSTPLVFAFLFGESKVHLSQSSSTAQQILGSGGSAVPAVQPILIAGLV